jgi:hypothetical protein
MLAVFWELAVHLHFIDQIAVVSSRTEGNVAPVVDEVPRCEDIWVTFP